MRFVETTERLQHLVEEAGLAADVLQPWLAWKVVQVFRREPAEGAACDALVQMGTYTDAGGPRIHPYLVRQFSDELAHDFPESDRQLAHLVCDLAFPAASLRDIRIHELWCQDYHLHSAFIDAVESGPEFQSLLNAEPISSRISWEGA